MEKYPDATENIDEVIPEPQGRPLSTTVYFESDHAHDQVTQRYVSSVIFVVGLNPISWSRNRQGYIETPSYSTEFCTGQVVTEEAISIW